MLKLQCDCPTCRARVKEEFWNIVLEDAQLLELAYITTRASYLQQLLVALEGELLDPPTCSFHS